jgi:hypothetical protein
MFYEWDPVKAATNLDKHGIDFADAIGVLEDAQALTVVQYHDDEERFASIGMDAFGRILVVIYTWRGEDTIRLISARGATRAERKQYEGERNE